MAADWRGDEQQFRVLPPGMARAYRATQPRNARPAGGHTGCTTEISVMAGILARMAEGDKQTGTELAWLADGIDRHANTIECCIS
ncbi:hypothetical protein [Komagataeibacter medellinensis]|uniref:hypothetical protein n=1 Tax=Komagataeibacter medellinensis TaxID=1177712 RepID=UPI0003A918AE|nr:hypothetical protein [Komagataeibacter medellinensis]